MIMINVKSKKLGMSPITDPFISRSFDISILSSAEGLLTHSSRTVSFESCCSAGRSPSSEQYKALRPVSTFSVNSNC